MSEDASTKKKGENEGKWGTERKKKRERQGGAGNQAARGNETREEGELILGNQRKTQKGGWRKRSPERRVLAERRVINAWGCGSGLKEIGGKKKGCDERGHQKKRGFEENEREPFEPDNLEVIMEKKFTE